MFGRDRKRKHSGVDTWATALAPDNYSPEEAAEKLERIPFFARLHPRDRRNLGAVGVPRSYPAGAEIVQEGQRPGVGFYVLLRGRVRVTQQARDGAIRDLGTLEAGDIFGEMALLDEEPRSTTVTAIEPTLAFIVPIFDFRAALANNGEAAAWLLSRLALRIRHAEEAQESEAPHSWS